MTRITRISCALSSAALVLAVSGCTAFSPIATEESYNPSDGVTIISGDVTINNTLLISDDGETARLIGQVTNTGDEAVTVSIQVRGDEGTSFTGQIAADTAMALTDDMVATGLGSEPGATVPVYVQAGSASGQEVDVPVLNGDLEQYASLVPSPSASE